MRIKWPSPIASLFFMTLSFGVFGIGWPVGAFALLDSLPGAKRIDYMLPMTTGLAMMFVGMLMAVHVGMLFARRTFWLGNRSARFGLLLVSGLVAAFMTIFDALGGIEVKGATRQYVFAYVAAVQVLPIVWFLYNLHGEAWLRLLTYRRIRHHKAHEAVVR